LIFTALKTTDSYILCWGEGYSRQKVNVTPLSPFGWNWKSLLYYFELEKFLFY
jgi:hypothetical protein